MSDLRFLSVELEDFKCFPEAKLKLDQKPGLYFISGLNKVAPELGANGVGKSSLWDAVLWCLFGRTGRDNRPGAAITPWDKKTMSSVHLKFARGDREYELVRSRNPNELSLYEPDGPRVIDQSEVIQLLGMSEEMFRRTVILGQFGTLFLDLPPEAKSQMFNEALLLDIWLKAAGAAGEWQRILDRDKERFAQEQAANTALLKRLRDDLDRARQQETEWFRERDVRRKTMTKDLEKCEAIFEQAKKALPKKPTYPDDPEELTHIARRITTTRESLAVLKRDLEATYRESDEVDREVKAMQKMAKQANKVCRECGQPVSNKKFEEQVEALVAKIKSFERISLDQEAEKNKLAKNLKTLQDEESRLEQSIVEKKRAYLDANAEWSTANQAYAVAEASVKSQRRKLEDEKKQTNPFSDQLERLRDDLENQLDEKKHLLKRVGEIEEGIETAKYWVEAFKKIRLSIIDQTLVELEMVTTRHMGMLGLDDWMIRFETEKETTSGKVNYSFTVLLYPPGQKEPVKWESYSGGEAQRLQLGVAFALSEVLLARSGINCNVEVLDEPTRGLSSAGVADLLSHLRERANELGRVIFFVDHHSLDKGDFDRTLLVTKEKKGSKMEWV